MNRAVYFFPTPVASHSFTAVSIMVVCFSLLFTSRGFSQDSLGILKLDSVRFTGMVGNTPASPTAPVLGTLSQQQIHRRITTVALVNVSGYAGAMVALNSAWYKDYPQTKFHTFNDIAEWKGIDKIGHAYSAYAESKASMELWRWTGIERKKRILLGGFSGAIYQTTIEVLDGFSSEWGWSWGDFAANMLGSGMLVAQEFAWNEQRVQFKWSFHRKKYQDAALNQRSDDLFGKGNPERFLKDYNGQTYWLSTTLKPFFPAGNIPSWLQVSVGTGIENVFGARSNIAKSKTGVITFDRSDLSRHRQWFLAPDVDLTKIKTNRKGVRLALNILNILKFPTPSVEFSAGKFRFNWLHF
jgi:uncharacterized protein YfiM (DUF2279 family)